MDLFYPDISVEVGGYTLSRGISITASSSIDSPCDWVRVSFTPDFPEAITLAKGDAATVMMGYGGELLPVFTGSVCNSFALSGQVNSVLLKDDMDKLSQAKINQVFVSCVPQEIIQYCCEQAGITKAVLSEQQFAARPSVPLPDTTALKAIYTVNQLWGIAEATPFFLDGCLYWGSAPEQSLMYTLEYGVNLIGLNKENSIWVAESVSLPFIKHSQKIRLQHPLVSGEFTVQRTVFKSDEKGFIRTQIYFK